MTNFSYFGVHHQIWKFIKIDLQKHFLKRRQKKIIFTFGSLIFHQILHGNAKRVGKGGCLWHLVFRNLFYALKYAKIMIFLACVREKWRTATLENLIYYYGS